MGTNATMKVIGKVDVDIQEYISEKKERQETKYYCNKMKKITLSSKYIYLSRNKKQKLNYSRSNEDNDIFRIFHLPIIEYI